MTGKDWSAEARARHGTAPGPAPTSSPAVADHDLPVPTIWPAMLALGIMLLAAGLATSLLVAVGGAAICLVAFRGWVYDLLGERGTHTTDAPLMGEHEG